MNTYSNLSAYPFPIIRAFTEVQIDYEGMEKDSEPEEVIKYFVSRWGGLDLDTFVHVLEVGQQDEKLLAIFVLVPIRRHEKGRRPAPAQSRDRTAPARPSAIAHQEQLGVSHHRAVLFR